MGTGYKDASDMVSLMGLMTEEEKAKTLELTKRTGRDKKLARLLVKCKSPVVTIDLDEDSHF